MLRLRGLQRIAACLRGMTAVCRGDDCVQNWLCCRRPRLLLPGAKKPAWEGAGLEAGARDGP